MKFEDSFLEKLRERFTLSRVIAPYVSWDRRRSKPGQGDFWGCCPFHQEKTPSFHVNDHKGFYHCFSCKVSGDLFSFLQEKEGLSFSEAVEKLALEAGFSIPSALQKEGELGSIQRWKQVMEGAHRFFLISLKGSHGGQAREYLARRGVGQDLQERFGLGYAPPSGLLSYAQREGISQAELLQMGLVVLPQEGGRAPYDRFRNRLIFPIWDLRGRLVAFGGRTLSQDGVPKYLNSPETPIFQKRNILYHFEKARTIAHQKQACFVVEGYMDVIAMVEAGFPNTVAPLGTALGEEQLQALWQLVREPTVCFDGDSAGRGAAYRLLEVALPFLSPGHSLKFVFFPQGMDPDGVLRTLGREALLQCLEGAIPFVEVLWQRHLEEHDGSTPERRALLERTLKDLVGRIADQTVRSHYQAVLREKLKALFAPRPRTGKAHTRSQDWNQSTGASASLKASLSGISSASFGQERWERLVVFACLTHPNLLDCYAEELSQIHFVSKGLDTMMQDLLNEAALLHPMDPSALRARLEQRGYGPLMGQVEAHAAGMAGPLARSSSPWERVQDLFCHILTHHRKIRGLEAELKMAQEALALAPTHENLERLSSARTLLLQAQGSLPLP